MKVRSKYILKRSVASALILIPATCLIGAGLSIVPLIQNKIPEFSLSFRQIEIISELSTSSEFIEAYNAQLEDIETRYTSGEITLEEYDSEKKHHRSVENKKDILLNIDSIDKTELLSISNKIDEINKKEEKCLQKVIC